MGGLLSLLSVLLCVGFVGFSLVSGDLLYFWLCLEMSGLVVMPCFYYGGGKNSLMKVGGSLLWYLIVNGLSSYLMLCGVMSGDLMLFTALGFLMKFGVFPFCSWLYKVLWSVKWVVIYLLSLVLKIPFFGLCFFMGGNSGIWLMEMVVSVGFLVVGSLFWVYSLNWVVCWVHMMISSSSVLFLYCFSSLVSELLVMFFIYVVWGSVCLFYSYSYSKSSGVMDLSSGVSFLMFVFIFLATPISLGIVYKVVLCKLLLGVGLFPMVCWVIYSVLEQVFLVLLLVGGLVPKSYMSYFTLV